MMYFLNCLLVAFLTTVSGVMGRAVSEIGNPVESPSQCGRSEPSYVCDPDKLLSDDEGKRRYDCVIALILISVVIVQMRWLIYFKALSLTLLLLFFCHLIWGLTINVI